MLRFSLKASVAPRAREQRFDCPLCQEDGAGFLEALEHIAMQPPPKLPMTPRDLESLVQLDPKTTLRKWTSAHGIC